MAFRIVGVDERGLPIFDDDGVAGFDEDSFLDRQEEEAEKRLAEAEAEQRNRRFAEAAEQIHREPEEGPPPQEATPEEAAAQERRAALTGVTTAASQGQLQPQPVETPVPAVIGSAGQPSVLSQVPQIPTQPQMPQPGGAIQADPAAPGVATHSGRPSSLGAPVPGSGLGPQLLPLELQSSAVDEWNRFKADQAGAQAAPRAPESVPVPPAGADPQTDRSVTGAPVSATAQALSDVPLEQKELDERAKAAGETNAANIMGARAREAAAEKKLDIATEKDAEAEALRAANIAERKERLAAMDEQWDKILNTKIEPKSIWRDGTTGQQISAVASAVLGGFLMHRTGGKNMGLELINKWVNRDLEAQVADANKNIEALKGKRGLYKDWLDVTQDEEAAIEMAKASAFARTGMKLEADMARIDAGPRARAAASAMLADIYAQARKFKEDGAARALDAAKTQAEIKYKNAQTANLYSQMRERRAKAAASAEAMRKKVEATRAALANDPYYGAAAEKTIINPWTNEVMGVARGTTDNITKLQEHISETSAAVNDLVELNQISIEAGRAFRNSGVAKYSDWAQSDAAKQYRSAYNDILDRLVRERSGAQTGEHEFKRFKDVVPFTGLYDNIEGTRKAIRDLGHRITQHAVKRMRGQIRGVVPGTDTLTTISDREIQSIEGWSRRNRQLLAASLEEADDTPLGKRELISRAATGDERTQASAWQQMGRDAARRPGEYDRQTIEKLKALPSAHREILIVDEDGDQRQITPIRYIVAQRERGLKKTRGTPKQQKVRARKEGKSLLKKIEKKGAAAVGKDPTSGRLTHKRDVRGEFDEFGGN